MNKDDQPEPVENEQETPPAEQPTPDNDELAKLRTERDELFERLARLQAEFVNARKRLEADKEQAVTFANSKLIRSLLPVIDNFERALAVEADKHKDIASLLKGMQIVHEQWLAVLAQEQVQPVAPEPGTPFDPQHMQAIMQQASEFTEPTVTQLFQKGYTLHGRTLRPAQVAVSKSE
jgi:molecular chaperone GrpE